MSITAKSKLASPQNSKKMGIIMSVMYMDCMLKSSVSVTVVARSPVGYSHKMQSMQTKKAELYKKEEQHKA
jgi:hypothetical protein